MENLYHILNYGMDMPTYALLGASCILILICLAILGYTSHQNQKLKNRKQLETQQKYLFYTQRISKLVKYIYSYKCAVNDTQKVIQLTALIDKLYQIMLELKQLNTFTEDECIIIDTELKVIEEQADSIMTK